MIHVQQDFGDGEDVNHRLEKAENGRKQAPALDDRGGANRVEGHVCYPCDDDQHEGERYGCIHWRVLTNRATRRPGSTPAGSAPITMMFVMCEILALISNVVNSST